MTSQGAPAPPTRRRQDTWLDRFVRRPLHPSVRNVTARFGFRLMILLLFAAMPFPHGWGFARMFTILAGFNAISCSVMALIHRDRLNTRALTHWDEALAMVVLFVIARLVA
jgi:hypothetical protein